VYGFGDEYVKMVVKERTCLFHWTESFHTHTKQLIALELQKWHKALCFKYKNTTSLEEADVQYVAI